MLTRRSLVKAAAGLPLATVLADAGLARAAASNLTKVSDRLEVIGTHPDNRL